MVNEAKGGRNNPERGLGMCKGPEAGGGMALSGPEGRSGLEGRVSEQMSGEHLRPAESLKSKFPLDAPDPTGFSRLVALATMTQYQARPR